MTSARRRLLPVGLLLLLMFSLLPAAPGYAAEHGSAGALYALTNAPTGSAVLAYARSADGSLTPAGSVPTGGLGTGAGLGSQNALIVDDDHRLLFAVNAGSDSISSFRIRSGQLELVGAVPSGGSMPTSLAYHHGLLYVLNAGVPNNLTGFRVGHDGTMTPLAGSARP